MYIQLAGMMIISGIFMFLLMYAMIYRVSDFYLNLSTFYMTLVMLGPMLMLEIILMGSAHHPTFSIALIAGGLIGSVLAFWAIRKQAGVNDAQFLRSMIPHHSAALTMATPILQRTRNSGIRKLAQNIINSQTCEINYMKELLKNPDMPYPC